MTNGIGYRSTIGHFWGPYKYHCFRFQPKVRNKISLKIAKNRWPIPLYGIWKKSGNEKWHFSEVYEKNSSNRNATWLPMAIGTCSACYQYPFVPRSIAIWRVFFMNFITKVSLFISRFFSKSHTMELVMVFGYF